MIQEVEQVIEYGRKCSERGYAPGTCGNISVLAEDKSGFYIKASGVSCADLRKNDVIFVDMGGNHNSSKRKPSMETRFHHEIYKQREDVGAVIHLHPPHSIAVSLAYNAFPVTTVSAKKFFSRIPLIAAADPGSDELKDLVSQCFSDSEVRGAVLKEHGIVTVGKDISEAFYLAELLEHDSEVTCLLNLIRKQ